MFLYTVKKVVTLIVTLYLELTQHSCFNLMGKFFEEMSDLGFRAGFIRSVARCQGFSARIMCSSWGG